jgi:hypothetical protein
MRGTLLTVDGVLVEARVVVPGGPFFVPVHAAELRPLVDPHTPAIERCIAARDLPDVVVRLLYSPSQMRNMRHVARQLCPALIERARTVREISLRLLIHVASGKTPQEQARRWDDYVLRAFEERQQQEAKS